MRRLILLSALLSAAAPLAGLAPASASAVFTPPSCSAATPPSTATCDFAVTTTRVELVVTSFDQNPATASIWCGANFATFVGGQATNATSTASRSITVSGTTCQLRVTSANPTSGVSSGSVAPSS